MSVPPLVFLVLAEGVLPDALAPAAELLSQFGVSFLKMTISVAGVAADPTARETVAGARVVIVASAEQRTPAGLAALGLPVIRVPSPVHDAIEHRLSLLVPANQDAAGENFATVAIGNAGARNAALFAIAVLAAQGNEELGCAWAQYRRQQTETVLAQVLPD